MVESYDLWSVGVSVLQICRLSVLRLVGRSCKISKLRDMGMMKSILLAIFLGLVVIPSQARTKRTITHCRVTVYHPVKSQTDDTPLITADGSRIDLQKLKHREIRWCAISRDLLWLFPKDKPKRILIEGLGVYEVRDTMNERFDHYVDILIHPSDKRRINERKKITIL